jgi:predicted nucleic acid-binding protein
MFGEMRLQIHDVDAAAVLAVAEAAQISYYDASYLWLAGHLGAPLISLDRQLMTLATPGTRST